MNLNASPGGSSDNHNLMMMNQSRNEAAKAASLSASNMKQHAKACTAWRNKVVAACQSNDMAGLTWILEEEDCPLKGTDKDAHWIPLIPYVFPKQRLPLCRRNNNSKPKGREKSTRGLLLQFLLEMVDPFWFLEPDSRSGRSGLHTACWLGDDVTVKAILDAARVVVEEDSKPAEEDTKKGKKSGKKKKKQNNNKHQRGTKANVKREALPNLNEPCDESGWPPLLYAALTGSVRCVELLLGEGASPPESKTSDIHTWLKQTSKPVGLVQFLQFTLSSSSSKKGILAHVESHGMALQELQDQILSLENEPLKQQYLTAWKIIADRLEKYPLNSTGQFSSLSEVKIKEHERAIEAAGRAASAESETVLSSSTTQSKKSGSAASIAPTETIKKQPPQRNEKKKKNRNKQTSTEEKIAGGAAKEADETPRPQPSIETDPLTVMMIEMGFGKEPVLEAIKALGGPNTATPDAVIAWMLDHPQDNEPPKQQERQKKPATVDRQEQPSHAEFRQPKWDQPQRTRSWKQSSPQDPPDSKRSNAIDRTESDVLSEKKKRQQEEQRLLAGKREEQRRRNREWNKKHEEAAFAGGSSKSNTNRVAQTKQPPPTPQAPVSNSNFQSPPAVVSANMGSNFNDISTVASSDVFDDATIATIESRISTNIQQPTLLQGFPLTQTTAITSAPVAPPGFGLSNSTGLVASLAAPVPIGDAPTPARDIPNDTGNFAASVRLSAPVSASAGVRPPGIPESHALVGDNNHFQHGVLGAVPQQPNQQLLPSNNDAGGNLAGMGLQPNLMVGGVAPDRGLYQHSASPQIRVRHTGQSEQYLNPSALLPADSLFGERATAVSHGLLGTQQQQQQISTDTLNASSFNTAGHLRNSQMASRPTQPQASCLLAGNSLESSLFGVSGDTSNPTIPPMGGQEGIRTAPIPPVGEHGFHVRQNHQPPAPVPVMGMGQNHGFAGSPNFQKTTRELNPTPPVLAGGSSLWGDNNLPSLGSGSNPASTTFLFGTATTDQVVNDSTNAINPSASLLLGSSVPVHNAGLNEDCGMWGDIGNGNSRGNLSTAQTNTPSTSHHSSIW